MARNVRSRVWIKSQSTSSVDGDVIEFWDGESMPLSSMLDRFAQMYGLKVLRVNTCDNNIMRISFELTLDVPRELTDYSEHDEQTYRLLHILLEEKLKSTVVAHVVKQLS